MARIILIETATSLCSVGLAEDGVCTHYKESTEPRAHAAMTAPFIKEILDEAGLRVTDCDAVCVSKGPGSYTGLRVGSSTAKGLAFGAGIPLIALGTLDILAARGRAILEALTAQHLVTPDSTHVIPRPVPGISPTAIIPMIDARRMEVYSAVFSPSGERLTPTASHIITAESFAAERAAGPVLFIGDGALKCREVLGGAVLATGPLSAGPAATTPSAWFLGECPRASSMAALAEAAFRAGNFEDTAYFEPFYLKDFVAALPSRKLF
jgi:tRNA threonylcarbamoyladenosine biosynthesis protein TsaB